MTQGDGRLILEALLLAGAMGATFMSLVVWIVKMSFQRKSEITDRYFDHLERSYHQMILTNERFSESFERLSDGIRALEEQSQRQGHLLERLTGAILENGRTKEK